jgi:predicted component of type VI protein secretion system
MNELTLGWMQAGRLVTQKIRDRRVGKHSKSVRIGRDPARCDIIIQHPTISGLHVEIFFNHQQNSFHIRNLKESNPPIINRKILTQGEVTLTKGSSILLGHVELKVLAVSRTLRSLAQPRTYSLICPKCRRHLPYERLNLGCPWDGTSLAAAESVLEAKY